MWDAAAICGAIIGASWTVSTETLRASRTLGSEPTQTMNRVVGR